MGRPKISEPRDRQLNLCLTACELENIRRRAEAVGMRAAHFGRALLLDENRKIKFQNATEDNHARLIYGQLVRLGNNLNQMVRHLHRSGDPLPSDLGPLLEDIRQIIARAPL